MSLFKNSSIVRRSLEIAHMGVRFGIEAQDMNAKKALGPITFLARQAISFFAEIFFLALILESKNRRSLCPSCNHGFNYYDLIDL